MQGANDINGGGQSYDSESTTLLTGMYGYYEGVFHEGIMQEVSGLKVGKRYKITFQQSIVQSSIARTREGQWRVYIGTGDNDMKVLGVSPLISIESDRVEFLTGPTRLRRISDLVWSPAEFEFVATAKTMRFDFGAWHPTKADTSNFYNNDRIRMGIDDIWLYCIDENCDEEEEETSCVKPANTSSTGLDTHFGITDLGRAGETSTAWPMLRKGGWMALESNDKGFVITRMTTAQIQALTAQEGMMVYDTDEKCLRLYDGTAWSCFSEPACPTE